MKEVLSFVIVFVWVVLTAPPSFAEYDPLTGLGYEEQPADTSASQGVVTLDELTEGLEWAQTEDEADGDGGATGETAAGEGLEELTALTGRIQAECSESQIAAYQSQMDVCFGGEEACEGYTSPGCLAADAPDEDTFIVVPLACFFECIAVKMAQCQPVFEALLESCQTDAAPEATGGGSSVSPSDAGSEPASGDGETTSECSDELKVRRNGLCVCSYGYQMNVETGACDFVTSGAGLDADGIEKVNDMVAAADMDSNGSATATVTINGKEVTVGVSADPNAYGSYRYTVDGIHYAPTLAEAVSPGFWSRVGDGMLDGARRGLSMVSPFNWFSGRYQGDDKDVKYRIGREVVYDDIDALRHMRVKKLKFMNDFLNGMALYIDLRMQGKSAQQIAAGEEDIDAEINRATERMRTAANRTDKNFTDEDKDRMQAAHDEQMYQAFEDGFLRYQLRLKMQSAP